MTLHSLKPDIGPPLPHSREAETAFLGAVLLGSPGTFEEMQVLECSDFFLPFNRLIYRHMKRLKNQGMPTNDIVLLVESLNATNELDAAGRAGYIAQLSDGLPKLSNLRHYVEIIKTKAMVRERLCLAELIREKLASSNGNAREILNEVSMLSAQLREEVAQDRILTFKTGIVFAAEAEQRIEWIAKGLVAKGAITELGAKVKMGKTTLVLAMVQAIVDGRTFLNLETLKTPVLYLTEQPAVSFRQAMARANLLTKDDFLILTYTDTRGVTWPDVASAAVKECKRVGGSLIVVDTLSQFAGLTGDRENNSGDALEAMAPLQLAAAEGIGVVVIRHERKSGGDVGDSGRGSSAFAGVVDIVLSLRKQDGNSPKTRRLLQSLSRFSETPTDLLVELRDGEFVALGDPGETALKDAKSSIFSISPKTEIEAASLADLVSNVGIARRTAQRAIDELVREELLTRIGKGKKGDPFRYFKPEFVSAQPLASSQERNLGTKESEINGVWTGKASA
jgi:DnaB-like helicase N terminal domain/AAA domain